MEFKMQKAEIAEMLNNAYGFNKKEIIGMEVKNNNLKIFSVSSNYFEQTSSEVDIIKEGKVFFDINIFLKIIKSLPEDLIKIKKEENIIKILSGKCIFNLRLSNPYNCSVKVNPEISMNFDTKNIIDAISRTNFVPNKKKKNFVLTYIFIKNNGIRFVGANPHMMGFYTFSESNLDNNSEIELCIIQEDFRSIYNVLKRNPEHNLNIGVDFKNNLILFSIKNITMVVKNNTSKYIERIKNYTEKFTVNNKIAIELEKQSLFSGIKQLIPLVEEDVFDNKLLFKIDDGNFSISDATGEGSVILLENVDIKNYEIYLNNKYIYEILKNNKSEKVNFEFPADDNTNPIMVSFQDDFSEYIVAPIRI